MENLRAFSINFGELEGSRTPNLLIRSQVLYPIELRVHFGHKGKGLF